MFCNDDFNIRVKTNETKTVLVPKTVKQVIMVPKTVTETVEKEEDVKQEAINILKKVFLDPSTIHQRFNSTLFTRDTFITVANDEERQNKY
jgi:hypothetical protein